jgi:hypothetical protein
VSDSHSGRDAFLEIVVPAKSSHHKEYGSLSPLVLDLISGKYLKSNDGQAALRSALRETQYDLAIVEQPWLFEGIKKHFSQSTSRIIYSSQNIESNLKADILRDFSSATPVEIKQITREIKAIESLAASKADEVWAVTAGDAEELVQMGATNVIHVPNGTRSKVVSEVPDEQNGAQYVLFVASAHPPNLTGFIESIGVDLNFIPPDFYIMCIGSICDLVEQWLVDQGLREVLEDRIVLRNGVSQTELNSYISHAKAIILPITSGGGSNLKTAEALASCQAIIATKKAMRGFEIWEQTPGVSVVEPGREFRHAISMSVSAEKQNYNRVSSLETPIFWPECLAKVMSGLLGRLVE